MTTTQAKSGLDGVIAAETYISGVDGQAGELIIAGFPVEELASQATFEEVTYLLWKEALPNADQLSEFSRNLAQNRAISNVTLDLLRAAAKTKPSVMDVLQMGVCTLRLDADSNREISADWEALLLAARLPTIIAAYWRLCNHKSPLAPRPDLSHAANYLYMLTGEEPKQEYTRALDTYLNTVADHGLNASTFTARVIISTQSDLASAVAGALGALKGPLHGGAPGPRWTWCSR